VYAPGLPRHRIWSSVHRAKTRGGVSLPALVAVAGLALSVFAASCGQSTPSAKAQTPAPPVAAPAASPPPGGPVPTALIGDWYLPPPTVLSFGFTCPSPPTAADCYFLMTLTSTTYQWFDGHGQHQDPHGEGNVVVNGNEIDFFSGVNCGLALPDGVGRYTWTLTGGLLSFTRISDPCSRDELVGQAWSRTP